MSNKDWEAKAAFMRSVNAVHAEWSQDFLTKLVLGPAPVARPAAPAEAPQPKGIAARLMKQHEIQFAHSRMKPPLALPSPDSDVPRAVRAKQGTSRGSTAKASKRAS